MMRFSVCWWNTGLAPPRGDANEPGHLKQVSDALDVIFTMRGVDLVFLGEVNAESLSFIQREMRFKAKILDLTLDDSGNRFNFGALIRDESIKLQVTGNYTAAFELKKYKGARKVDASLSEGSVFSFLVVHWPSRIRLPPESLQRVVIAQQLRNVVDAIQELDPTSKLIILGDFNDEPFNDSIARGLAATRDLSMVRRDSRLLYNPFWRSLSGDVLHDRHTIRSNSSGTYYFASGSVHRWHTLDQMLFSSSLVANGPWHLCESEATVWEEPAILGVGPAMSKTIDHLPIFSVLESDAS